MKVTIKYTPSTYEVYVNTPEIEPDDREDFWDVLTEEEINDFSS